jgi:hypothetical protein
VLLDARDAEEVRLPAQGQYQVVVGKIPVIGVDTTIFEVYILELRSPEARAGLNKGSAQRLRNVTDIHVAADHTRNHGPKGEEGLPGDNHHPDVVPMSREIAEGLRGRIPAEPASQDEHPVGKLAVRGLLPRRVPGPGL